MDPTRPPNWKVCIECPQSASQPVPLRDTITVPALTESEARKTVETALGSRPGFAVVSVRQILED